MTCRKHDVPDMGVVTTPVILEQFDTLQAKAKGK